MKPTIRSMVLGGIVSSLLFVGVRFRGERSGIVPEVHAQENQDNSGCTTASVKGAYGFYRTGATSVGPLAAVGIATFDGAGATTARQSIRRNGVTTSDLFADPQTMGLYEVFPDCTGKFLFLDGTLQAPIVVVDGGREIISLSQTSGNSVYGVFKKINKED